MKRLVLLCAVLLCGSVAASNDAPKRPRIFGIARVQIFTSDISAARSFYSKVLDHAHDCNWCEEPPGRSFLVNSTQAIGLSRFPSPAPSNLLEEIAFATDNIPELRRYLMANKITVSKPRKPQDNYLTVVDPEGHRIDFVQQSEMLSLTGSQTQALDAVFTSKLRIIHAGFVVRDKAVEDRFYKDVLGFRVYWHGGMKDGTDDWVDMQVPEGTDWLEYMLNVSPNALKKELGVMNHIAIGVADIKSATERLREDNAVPILEEPKIGRDGKWQLNLYDPDETRVEFMEFKPVEKPCCSEFTGPHPGPKP